MEPRFCRWYISGIMPRKSGGPIIRVIGRVLEGLSAAGGGQAVLWCYLMIEPEGRRFMIRRTRVESIESRRAIQSRSRSRG